MDNKIQINNETNRIQKDEFVDYLIKVDEEYISPISNHVILADYAEKLIHNAIIVTARDNRELVGLCAFYCNDYKNKRSFISTIGIQSNFTGKGIAKKILNKTIEISIKDGMEKIELEVFSGNKRAISFYHKNGFYIVDTIEKLDKLGNRESWNLMCKTL